ncbi:MAG: hypothetical protein CL674_09780 [Bdellovibrionaceae bacterium]|nr:hypothetical protein [Pseudobdellovibrionaceae bacterium]
MKKRLNYSFGIAAKMILVVSLIIIGAISTVVFIATDLFKDESITRAQENNKDSANNLSDRVYSAFQSSSQTMKLMAQFATNSSNIDEARRAIQNTIDGNEDLVSFYAYLIDEKGAPKLIIKSFSETAVSEFSVDKDKLLKAPENKVFIDQYQKPDEFLVINSAPYTEKPFYTLSFMSRKDKEEQVKKASKEHVYKDRWIFRAELRHSSILRIFPKKSFVSSYLVSPEGILLAHSKKEYLSFMMQLTDFSDLPIVDKMLSSKSSNHQMEYIGDYDEEYLGAYKRIGVAGLGVVSEISKQRALATITRVQVRSLWVMIIIVCLAFFVNYGFSSSITQPIKSLFAATEQIVQGNFDVRLQASSTDEIGALSEAFSDMASGLKERDKIKTAFGKFHSKEVAQKLLSGEIKLGGERKQATVFFSDIRGFTAMSENMSPDEVVAMLNEYMTEMVRIIFKWEGVVDKYIGDAIMAVWGVPEVKAEDSYNAVRACLEMREFMNKFNKEKSSEGKPKLGVGIGLHSGEVLAGNIGSEERLEYTIIGDTVNQASRIEGANKAVSSDILISAETYALVKEKGIVAGPAIAIKAKGKSNDVYVHQVIGYMEEDKLVTDLSEDQIEFIESMKSVEMDDEEKVSISSSGDSVATSSDLDSKAQVEKAYSEVPSHSAQAFPVLDQQVQVPPMAEHRQAVPQASPLASKPQIQKEPKDWYLVDSLGAPLGPYSVSEIALKVAHGQVQPTTTLAFKNGDAQSIYVANIPGVNRRKEMPEINIPVPPPAVREEALEKHWYLNIGEGDPVGPYSVEQVQEMLLGGNITRTTYVWSPGYEKWIYAYQIPGFDRRSA